MKDVALVIGAHPDDVEFAMGGTVALWVSQGRTVHYLIMTDGSKGSSDPSQCGRELARLRVQEQHRAAAVLGAAGCTFLEAPDGEVEPTRALLGRVVHAIRLLRPHVVCTHNPASFEYRRPGTPARISHRDHRVTGQLVLDAVYPACRDPLNFPEHIEAGLTAHKVPEVLLWGSPQADYKVDVTATFEKKLEALRAHASQVPSEWTEAMRARWSEDGRYFEYFHRLEIP